MRTDRAGKLSLHPLSGYWYRALSLRHWKTRLSTGHTRTASSRFGAGSEAAPGPDLLYLGENHQVAIYEVGALLGDPGSPVSDPRGSWVVMSLDIRLERVADLCDPAEQSILETSHQELTGDWMNGPGLAPTQELGAALYGVKRLQGFLFPSSKPSGGRNLVIFLKKLTPGCRVAFRNDLDDTFEAIISVGMLE